MRPSFPAVGLEQEMVAFAYLLNIKNVKKITESHNPVPFQNDKRKV